MTTPATPTPSPPLTNTRVTTTPKPAMTITPATATKRAARSTPTRSGSPAEAMERFGIKVAPVEARALSAVVTAPARVGFNTEAMAHVGSLVSGRVAEIKVRLGEIVNQGDVLLVVDSPELGQLQGDYLSALSGVEAATPAVELAQSSYGRTQKLFDETEGGGVTLNTVQEREATLRSAQRELAMADADVTAAANTLRLHGMTDAQIDELAGSKKVAPTYEVVAPIAGEVVEREVTPGELVSPEDESLMVLADLSTVWVLADVAEANLGQVGVGSSASIDVVALSGQTFEGKVTYVDPRVNEGSRTARLRVEVEEPGGQAARRHVRACDGRCHAERRRRQRGGAGRAGRRGARGRGRAERVRPRRRRDQHLRPPGRHARAAGRRLLPGDGRPDRR